MLKHLCQKLSEPAMRPADAARLLEAVTTHSRSRRMLDVSTMSCGGSSNLAHRIAAGVSDVQRQVTAWRDRAAAETDAYERAVEPLKKALEFPSFPCLTSHGSRGVQVHNNVY